MAVKLGEMLVKGGIITLDQLEEALKYQVIFGGKLGTNLIELGFIEEEELAWFLSEKLGVPYVHPEKLMDISPNTIKLIPKDLAKKYRVIPFNLEKKKLNLVMADPSDLNAIDEISFTTDLTIKPLVTPEVRLALALERYYHIERDVRYIPIIERSEKKATEEFKKPAAEAPAPPPEREGEVVDLEDELEEVEIIEEEERREILKEFTIDEVSRELAGATEREEIADVLIGYTGREFKSAALFIVRGDSVVGWRAFRNGNQVEGAGNLHINLDESSVLKTVTEGKSFYLGPLPNAPNNTKLIKMLGGDNPSTVLLVPIMIMGKIVNILYVTGEDVDLGKKVPDLQRLVNKASMAFEILILRNKIMMT